MRWRGQEGFTLPELLVVMAILPIALVTLLSALDTTAQIAPRSIEHSAAVGEAGTGMSRAIREIRKTYRVVGTTPNSLTFLTETGGATTQVNISCGITSTAVDQGGAPLRRCVRTTAAAGAALPAPGAGSILIDRVVNGTDADPVFQYAPNAIAPTYVRMLVKVPPQGEGNKGTRTEPIIIEDGTLLRNNALGL